MYGRGCYLTLALFFFFFFNDTATTEIYTLSLHDALPICRGCIGPRRSHRSTAPSAAAVANVVPSALNATSRTDAVLPSSGMPTCRGVAGSVRSHSTADSSGLAVASIDPSGLNATAFTHRAWPLGDLPRSLGRAW